MRVLVINTCMTRQNGITGVIFNLMNSGSWDDICIDYLAINKPDGIYYDYVKRCRGDLFVINRSGKSLVNYIRTLSKLIKQKKYDAVHVHGNSSTMIIELLASMLGGCRTRIIHSHNTTCEHVLFHKLTKSLFNCMCTDRMACGKAAGEWMFGKRRFIVVNNGVNVERFKFELKNRIDVREHLGIRDNTLLIGHIGTFSSQKNHEHLLNVLEQLKGRGVKNYRALFVGQDGGTLDSVKRIINQKELQDVVTIIEGSNEVYKLLSAIDLIVMPSRYEGLPLTLIEEQTNGLQCLVSDVITNEVDKTGLVEFIALEDYEKWILAIENKVLGVDRKDKSIEAIKKITNAGYNIESEAKKIEQYYKVAIKRKE